MAGGAIVMLRGYNETALFAIIEGVIIRTDGRIEGSRDLSGIFGLKRRITLLIVVAAALGGVGVFGANLWQLHFVTGICQSLGSRFA